MAEARLLAGVTAPGFAPLTTLVDLSRGKKYAITARSTIARISAFGAHRNHRLQHGSRCEVGLVWYGSRL